MGWEFSVKRGICLAGCLVAQVFAPLLELSDIECGDLCDVLISDSEGERFGLEPVPFALRTGGDGEELIGPFLRTGAVVVVDDGMYILDDAVEVDEV